MSPLALFGSRSGHPQLFSDLCRYYDLDRKTKLLLREVATKFCADKQANVFLLPDVMRRAMDDPAFSERAEELRELHQTWFVNVRTQNQDKTISFLGKSENPSSTVLVGLRYIHNAFISD